jgi:hypothetical protein
MIFMRATRQCDKCCHLQSASETNISGKFRPRVKFRHPPHPLPRVAYFRIPNILKSVVSLFILLLSDGKIVVICDPAYSITTLLE